ncbi:MAG: ABC transporter permease, partial [Treponema sp.]|nr:ABC transporter permease [Candidatus Treponema equi]
MKIFRQIKSTVVYPWTMFRKKAPLGSFILSRLVTMLVLLYLLGFALFGLMELAPGDIVDQMMSQQIMTEMTAGKGNKNQSTKDAKFSEEQEQKLREEFGIDKPFYVQYSAWLKRVVIHHDLGTSLISRAPVSFLIRSRIWNSVLLNIISLVFITGFSFLLGVYFSSKAGT